MPTATDEPVAAHTSTAPRELLATPPPITTLLRIPRRCSSALLHILQILSAPFIKHGQPDPSLTVPRYTNGRAFDLYGLQEVIHVSRLPFFTHSCTRIFYYPL